MSRPADAICPVIHLDAGALSQSLRATLSIWIAGRRLSFRSVADIQGATCIAEWRFLSKMTSSANAKHAPLVREGPNLAHTTPTSCGWLVLEKHAQHHFQGRLRTISSCCYSTRRARAGTGADGRTRGPRARGRGTHPRFLSSLPRCQLQSDGKVCGTQRWREVQAPVCPCGCTWKICLVISLLGEIFNDHAQVDGVQSLQACF